MAARSEAEINSLLVYKSPARQGGVLYFDDKGGDGFTRCPSADERPGLHDLEATLPESVISPRPRRRCRPPRSESRVPLRRVQDESRQDHVPGGLRNGARREDSCPRREVPAPLRVAGHDPDQHGRNGCRRSYHPPKGEEAWIAGPQCIRDARGARLSAGGLCEVSVRPSLRTRSVQSASVTRESPSRRSRPRRGGRAWARLLLRRSNNGMQQTALRAAADAEL